MEVMEKPTKVKQYKITINSEADVKGGGGDVFIGWNGRQNLYKRDVECPIDQNFLDVLKATVIETKIEGADGTMRSVRVPRFTYSVEPA